MSRPVQSGELENKLGKATISLLTFCKRRVDKESTSPYSSGVIHILPAMNSKFLKAFAAIAFMAVASSPLGHAAAVSPSDFKSTLIAKVGTKKGTSASNAAAKYFGSVLKDKLNKKNADKYAKSVITVLKKAVPLSSSKLAGNSVNACLKQLLTGYFKGLKFSLTDKTYNKAQTALLKGLPPGARTPLVSQALYNTIKTFAEKKNVSQDQVYSYYIANVSDKTNIPPPPVS